MRVAHASFARKQFSEPSQVGALPVDFAAGGTYREGPCTQEDVVRDAVTQPLLPGYFVKNAVA